MENRTHVRNLSGRRTRKASETSSVCRLLFHMAAAALFAKYAGTPSFSRLILRDFCMLFRKSLLNRKLFFLVFWYNPVADPVMKAA